jgi:uncharacterized protein with HEPN domain
MWRDDAYLLDILLAARRAREFAKDVSWESFQKSRLHQDAIVRVLSIIGEAANRVSPEFKKAHPEIPWHEIVGMRHRLIHDYINVNLEKVWDAVQNDVPKLIARVEPLVPPPD